jgi:hypothetical protein
MDEFDNLQNAIYEAIANTECKNAVNAVMALCAVMCDMMVQLKMDNENQAVNAVIHTLRLAKENRQNTEIH